MPRLVYVVTHPSSARVLLASQAAHMRSRGFDVVVIASPGEELAALAEQGVARTAAIPLSRQVRPFSDLVALFRLYRTIRRLRPQIVNAGTPKAGMLGMLAAWLAGVPIRIYTLRGLRLETTHSVMRFVLRLAERVASACANRVVCVSDSLKQLYLNLGLTTPNKAVVLGRGSSKGVDANHFCASPGRLAEAAKLRVQFGIPDRAPVVGFVGRLTRDKGIVDLVDALDSLRSRFPETRLFLLGDFEEGDPVPDDCVRRVRQYPWIIVSGIVQDTAPYYPMMDVLAFPSRREGLPNAILEAAASELPAVAFRATGTVDAVEDGVTGTLVPGGNVRALSNAIGRYLQDPGLRRKHGRAGRQRVLRDFRQEVVHEALEKEYLRCLREKGLPVPELAAKLDAASPARPVLLRLHGPDSLSVSSLQRAPQQS